MAAILDMSSFDEALKVHYTDHRIKNMVYKNNPTLALVPKYESFGGRNLPMPIRYGVPQGRSAAFGTAQTNKYSSNYAEFLLTRVKDYAVADIDNEALEASVGDKNAFMRAAVSEIDGCIHSATRSLASALFRDGTGSVGTIGAVTATTITLTDPESVANFEVGQVLVASAAPAGTALGSAESTTITDINRDTGVLTVADDTTAFGHPWVVTDHLYVEGDLNSKLSGFEAWVPATAPGATLFFNVDRTTDVTRLGGVRYDGSSETIEEALISAAARVGREGGRPSHVIMNHKNYSELLKSLGQRAVYDSVRARDVADISFDSVKLHTATGVVQVLPDHNCQVDVAWMLQMDTWKLCSLKAAPRILMSDGMRFLRNSSADSVEVRCGYYAQLGCSAPGWNARVTLAS